MPSVDIGEDSFAAQLDGMALNTGDEIMHRAYGLSSATAVTLTSGVLTLTHFNARKPTLSTQVRVLSGSTAAGATPTVARIGLYLVARDPTLNASAAFTGTLVASTANDTALFAAANTAYTKSWSTPYRMLPGQRYALGVLVVTGAAAPTLIGSAFAANTVGETLMTPRISGTVTGQTDLPASYVEGSMTAAAGRLYGVILP